MPSMYKNNGFIFFQNNVWLPRQFFECSRNLSPWLCKKSLTFISGVVFSLLIRFIIRLLSSGKKVSATNYLLSFIVS